MDNRYERLKSENPLSKFVEAVYAGKPVDKSVKAELTDVLKSALTLDSTSQPNPEAPKNS